MTDVIAGLPPGGMTARLHVKAAEMEAAFLSEMLAHAGLDDKHGGFGGGAGGEQFASFLREEQSRALVAHGGIGLTESLFKALMQRAGDER
ncbi:MAG: chemotaxis protein chel [Gemmobacter sp.]|nr:chemotaxis protein chel [Gemmobacter sp.]